MATNKVVFGNNTLIDLTSDTVTAADLTVGVTAHAASGALITGTKKLPGYITLAANTGTLDSSHTEISIEITGYSGEDINVSSSDATIADADIESFGDEEIRHTYAVITSPGSRRGTAVITVTTPATTTYEAATAYIFVTADFPGTDIVSWASGSDDQLLVMVNADRNGDIDLRDYWSVGDERTVVLPEIPSDSVPGGTSKTETQPIQIATFVLMHKGGNNDDYRFVVGLKECLSNPGFINNRAGYSYAGCWSATDRAYWCDHYFYNALPTSFRSIFKLWTCHEGEKTGNSSYSSTTINDSVYFALPAEKEIIGSSASTSVPAEINALFQFDYYKTDSNRIKKLGALGEATTYYTRSPNKANNQYCAVGTTGAVSSLNVSYNYKYGISPVGRV